jgi:hypothetical protein
MNLKVALCSFGRGYWKGELSAMKKIEQGTGNSGNEVFKVLGMSRTEFFSG